MPTTKAKSHTKRCCKCQSLRLVCAMPQIRLLLVPKRCRCRQFRRLCLVNLTKLTTMMQQAICLTMCRWVRLAMRNNNTNEQSLKATLKIFEYMKAQLFVVILLLSFLFIRHRCHRLDRFLREISAQTHILWQKSRQWRSFAHRWTPPQWQNRLVFSTAIQCWCSAAIAATAALQRRAKNHTIRTWALAKLLREAVRAKLPTQFAPSPLCTHRHRHSNANISKSTKTNSNTHV